MQYEQGDLAVAPPGVFISYSGPLSQEIAANLRGVLNGALHVDIRLFPHKLGIPMMTELFEGLARSSFGICCMTRDNARSRWIHFEAGSLLKFVPDEEMRGTDSITSRIVPFYYPRRPTGGDPLDAPLSAFKGKEATADSVVELVHDIARHLDVIPRQPDDQIRTAWEAADIQITKFKSLYDNMLRVGRFSSYHDDIITHCTAIDARDNDFRKFLCDHLLSRVRDAVSELAMHRPSQLRNFYAFAERVTEDLCKVTEIVALCGSKPWEAKAVSDYYRAQYKWAKRAKWTPNTSPPAYRLRRIFVAPDETSDTESHAKDDRRGLLPKAQRKVYDDHVALAEQGVAARIVTQQEIRKGLPKLERVWSDLVNRGFGFIAMRSLSGWTVHAHQTRKEGSGTDDDFLSVIFDSTLVASSVIDLFEELWKKGT